MYRERSIRYFLIQATYYDVKCVNESKEVAGKWQNKSLCQTNLTPTVRCYNYVKFRIEKQCLVKHFAFLKNVCYINFFNFVLWVTYCFLKSCRLVRNHLGMYCYFPVIRLVNFD